MKTEFTYKTTIRQSQCDFSNQLGIYNTMCLVNDVSAMEGEELLPHIGLPFQLGGGEYLWIVAKIMLDINRRPNWGEEIIVKLKAERLEAKRGYRSFEISNAEGEKLITGRTCMALTNHKTGEAVNIIDLFQNNNINFPGTETGPEFSNIRKIFDEASEKNPELIKKFSSYKVLSLDNNFGGHVDNAWFVRMGLSMLSRKELTEMQIKHFELHYISSSFEGDVIDFYRTDKKEDASVYLKACVNDKVTALYKIS